MNKLNIAPLFLGLVLACGDPAAVTADRKLDEAGTNYSSGTKIDPKDPEYAALSVEQKLLQHFQYTRDFDSEAKLYLAYDMKNLANWSDLSRPAAQKKLAAVTGLATVSAATLAEWFMDRVSYFYPSNGNKFEIALIVPSEERIYNTRFEAGAGSGVAALNISASLYQILANNRDQGVEGLQFQFDDTYVPFLSTRGGVVKLGPSLIDEDDTQDSGQDAGKGYRLVKSLFRLNVLLHEARHSDGNDAAGTFGFAHSNCPADGSVASELAGLPACDTYANGAYNVGAQLIGGMIGICDGICSASDTGGLDAARIDVLSRILVEDTEANYGDANPEPSLPQIDVSNFTIIE